MSRRRARLARPLVTGGEGISFAPSPLRSARGAPPRGTRAWRYTGIVGVAVFLSTSTALAAYEAVDVKDGGVLSGRVSFSGTPPKLEPIAVNKNRDVCGERKPSEALLVGA
ncbi:MAG TPA: hypothetical protein VLF19_00810, partial [Methylomirabilota bacterium]|nr:hypothetical protein [Methylomirabilota bacterium]